MPASAPPVDTELASMVDPGILHLALTHDAVRSQRALTAAPPTLDELRCDGAFVIEEHRASVHGGAPDVPVLVCRPAATVGRLPILFFLHGGGPVAGHARHSLGHLLRMAREVSAAVVCVEYRPALDRPYPAASEDCPTALSWLADRTQGLGVDAGRIVLIGRGGGGALAGGLSLRLRDRLDLRPLGQMLLSPVLDDRTGTAAACRLFDGSGSTARTDRAAWPHVRGERRGTPEVSAHAAPARAEDLSGLPPLHLEVGALEVLRDEVVRPHPPLSGTPAATPNCTSGPALSTASTSWPPAAALSVMPAPPGSSGCDAC
ncbi:alpha/beta hydrolase fold domain-containing protein [Streptomyces sp. NPDC102406]|uniref:alpha/beta hydrolase fold domain-containing protein n=1 Tax=Streptomyces sp. NPDC102406 TaxID=3366171 RepID=UPI0037FF8322